MKKQLVLLVMTIGCIINIYAQNYSEKFGKISQEEADLKMLTWDPSAEAVVLFDYATSCFVEIGDNMGINFERTTRLKIFNEAGLDYANVEVPYYQDKNDLEKVSEIKVNIYNFENGLVKKNTIEKIEFFDEKINENWTLRKFAIPNVKAGSIIEYKYSIQSPYIFNLQDWNFQWKIPVLYSEYLDKLVPFYKYQYIVQGVNKLDVYENYTDGGLPRHFGSQEYNDKAYRFALKNIPAFRDLECITSLNDYLIKIDFQLCQIIRLDGSKIDIITTWPALIKELQSHQYFGKFIKKSESSAAMLFNLKEVQSLGQKERFNFVVNYVKNNFKWNGRNSKIAINSVDNLIKKKEGNSAEINLLLIGLLQAVDIDVLPVISSTREHGRVKNDFPFLDLFNYTFALVNVDGQNFLIDATEISCPNERIPFRCINDKGLVIKKDEVKWIGLQSTIPSVIETTLKMNLSDSVMKSEIENSATEYDAMEKRAKFGNDFEKIQKEIEKKGYNVMEQSLAVKNLSEIDLPYIITFKTTNKPNIIGNKMYIYPFLNDAISENPLKQTKSSYPLDMAYPQKRILNSTINIPEGYKIDSKPENFSFQNKLYDIDYKIEVKGDTINIQFIYSFKNSVYPPEDYAKIKYYFDEIVEKANQKIVFVKI
jgi:hypothetical protein